MFQKTKNFILLLAGCCFLLSCSEYQKVLKNEDVKPKYDLAEKFYSEGDYRRANRLLDQIYRKYIGKPQGERVLYFYAQSHYKLKNYFLAAYQFEQFQKSYPQSDKREEVGFLGAKSYYNVSPKFSIDQTDTQTALSKLQIFINSFPESEYLSEANSMAQELTQKLEKKAFQIAKQYNTLADYKAAVEALDNFLSDHPGSPYREDAMYYKLSSFFLLAEKSVSSKMKDRYLAARSTYNTFVRYYPDSGYKRQADEMYAAIEQQLNKIAEN